MVELLHGEGGDDAKLFASQLRQVYERYAASRGLAVEVLADGDGHFLLRVSGRAAGAAFAGEAGKHCVQSARSGKRHTSFVTVAVLPLPPERELRPIPERELEVKTQTGRQKAGGQNVNKVASAVRMRHVPTGLSVFVNGRDQGQNRREALRVLTARVNELRNGQTEREYSRAKAEQLGDRGRGGKVRTYNFIQGRVTDHRTGRETSDVKAVMRGDLGLVL